MTEHQLERIHNYTKYKVVELLISSFIDTLNVNHKDNEGGTGFHY